MRIRGGSGLGDAVYIRPVAEHFERLGHKPTVHCDYPEVFAGSGINVEPFRRDRIDVLAHYVAGKSNPATTQWQDVCKSAGIQAPLSFDWPIRNQKLVDGLRAQANGRKLVLVHGGRAPMARTDGFGKELLPDRKAFHAALEVMQNCMLVKIGKGSVTYGVHADVDLTDKTSITDTLDLFRACDGVIAQCSFAIPMAEVFDRPLLVVWAGGGLVASHIYVRQITPAKILSKPSSTYVMDDWETWRIQEGAYAFVDRLLIQPPKPA